MLYVSKSTDTPSKWVWTVAETCSSNIFRNYCNKSVKKRVYLNQLHERCVIRSLVNQLCIPDVHYAHNISPISDIAKCNYINTLFYVLLTLHPCTILVINPTRCTILLNIFLFSTCFGHPCAHHQERITVSMRH